MRFTLATGGMVALLALGIATGGPWAGLALAYITVCTFFMDRIVALAGPDAPGDEFPAGDGLSVALGVVHFPLLFGGVAALVSDRLETLDKALVFVALSLFVGQVGNANAHELIHRAPRRMRRLGTAVYASILYGHHVSAHRLVHHVHAATPRDPNSARLGESYWAFVPRAWIGGFRAGFRAEAARGRGLHPYAGYFAGSAASLAFAAAIGGIGGMVALLGIAVHAQLQLLLSDYVQHYGLVRAETAPGRFAPIGPEHSWNAPHGFSSALMLNAPRHSDHHARPATPYPGLMLDRVGMPLLPQSLPVMAVMALVPPVWRRLMDHRARKWTDRTAAGRPRGGHTSPGGAAPSTGAGPGEPTGVTQT